MSKEAMKLALEALVAMNPSGPTGSQIWHQQMEAITALQEELAKPDFWEGYVPEPVKPATEESSATQAQQALDKMAENARELGLDYEPVCNKDPQGCWNVRCQLGKKCKNTPAQQEPVAWGNFKEDGTLVGLSQHPEDQATWTNRKPLYTSPPAQRTWVGLPESAFAGMTLQQVTAMKYAEQILKDQNT